MVADKKQDVGPLDAEKLSHLELSDKKQDVDLSDTPIVVSDKKQDIWLSDAEKLSHIEISDKKQDVQPSNTEKISLLEVSGHVSVLWFFASLKFDRY